MATINFTIHLAEQDAICRDCPLADCVGADNRDCPIQVEQRRRWREINKQRVSYFIAREQKQKAEKTRKVVINV